MDIEFDNYKISTDDKLTVITGLNGSGKTRAIKIIQREVEKNNQDYVVLACDSHCHLSQAELKKFAGDLKEKSKSKNVIIASLRKEIIDIADNVITL